MHQLRRTVLLGAACLLTVISASLGIAEEQAVDEGLLGHWPLDAETWSDQADEAKDVSGHEHHADIVGATLVEDEQRGWCAQFDGEDDHIIISEADGWLDVWNRSFTIEAWVKTHDVKQNWQGIVTGGVSKEALHIHLHSNQVYAFTQIGGTELQKLSSANVQSDRWYHIAVTRDGETGSTVLYLNGEPADDFKATGQAGRDLTAPIMISSGRNSFNGKISDVKIWSVVRTPEQIMASADANP